MLLILRLIAVAAIWLGSGALCAKAGIPPRLGLSLPSLVDTGTPETVWKGFGIVLWIASLVVMLYMHSHQGA